MALAIRIIPTLLVKNSKLVKGKAFAKDRIVGHALQALRLLSQRGVDELLIFDVSNGPPDYEFLRSVTECCFSPIAVGGGVQNLEIIRDLLYCGADRVVIKSHLDLIEPAARRFGCQAVAVCIDVPAGDGSAVGRAQAAAARGAGEIVLQAVERDGTMKGYDLPLIAAVAAAVPVPVVASGGCSGYDDMHAAILAGASAVAVGALFQFTAATPRGAAEYLHSKGIEARIPV